jgi:hypothetical protein
MSREVQIARYLDQQFNHHLSDIIIEYARYNLWELNLPFLYADESFSYKNIDSFLSKIDNVVVEPSAFHWHCDSELIDYYKGDVLILYIGSHSPYTAWIRVTKEQQSEIRDYLRKYNLLHDYI